MTPDERRRLIIDFDDEPAPARQAAPSEPHPQVPPQPPARAQPRPAANHGPTRPRRTLAGIDSRKAAACVGLGVALLASGAGYIWWGLDHKASKSAGSTALSPPTLDRHTQAREVGRALKTLGRDPQALVAASSRSTVGDHARRAVPVGSAIKPDEHSWRPDGVGGGVMAVTVKPPGGASVSYAAVMVHEKDGWKVLATVPLSRPHRTLSTP